mgnify:CR=1 FL=1
MPDNKTKDIVPNEEAKVKRSGSKIRKEELLDQAKSLPKLPGCYLMQGKNGEILYVGKAKNLKNRVTSYFNTSAKTPKTQILVGHIYTFEFMITHSDAESFVLENNLIKKHKPKYNIRLKDDKTYPYVQVNFKHEFPRLEYVRRPKRKKHLELYGPYPYGSNISAVLKTLAKAYQLRDCSDHEFKTRTKPCLLYQMKQCTAPCVGKISAEDYQKDLRLSLGLLKSKKHATKSLQSLTELMMRNAEDEHFEKAAMLRDYIEELDTFCMESFEQSVENLDENNIDIIAYHKGSEELDISIYIMRRGNLVGHKNFHFLVDDLLDEVETEVMQALLQYYSQSNDILPEKIITMFDKENILKFEQALLDILGEGLRLKVYSKNKKYESLLLSTLKHASETQRLRLKHDNSVFIGLNKLKSLLKLKDRPKTLECYDIAVWQGKSPTASQVVFYEGKPDKVQYRHYHMTELPEGNNDFAMMREVFERRLKYGNFPDVFIVDGGKQQVNTVLKVFEEFDVTVPVVGIAKAKDIKAGGFRTAEYHYSEERLVIPNRANPYVLNKCSSLMKIVVGMRDEAHRFSRRLHHNAEKKRVITSWIDEVKGLNPEIRKQIKRLNIYSRDDLKEMSENEIAEVLELNSKHASLVCTYLHAEEN